MAYSVGLYVRVHNRISRKKKFLCGKFSSVIVFNDRRQSTNFTNQSREKWDNKCMNCLLDCFGVRAEILKQENFQSYAEHSFLSSKKIRTAWWNFLVLIKGNLKIFMWRNIITNLFQKIENLISQFLSQWPFSIS